MRPGRACSPRRAIRKWRCTSGAGSRSRLGLTPEQSAKIDPVIQKAVSDIHAIRMEAAQRVNKVFEGAYAQVSAILTPEQRAKLEELQKERRAMMQSRWQEGHRRGGFDRPGGPGGPRRDGNRPGVSGS